MRAQADGNMGEQMQARRVPLGADPRVLKVLGNEGRWKVFSRLGDRPWSATQLRDELGMPYEAVRDHIRVLVREGLAETAGYEPGPRGGRQTLYRADRFFFTAEEWAALPEEIRKSGSSTFVDLLIKDAVDSLRSGTMEAREDHVLLRRPLYTDDEGAKEIEKIMVRAYREIADADLRSLERRNRSGAKPVRLVTALLSFPGSDE